MGGSPQELPGRYARTSPLARVPIGLPQRLFHGQVDTVVPIDQSRAYVAAAAAAGDDATLTEQPDANHFTVLEPKSAAWGAVRAGVDQLLGR